MVGGLSPKLRQSKAGGVLRRVGADALAKRICRARARRLQSLQSEAADDDDSARARKDFFAGRAIAPAIPKAGEGENRGAVCCREKMRLLVALVTGPFIKPARGDDAALPLKGVTKHRLVGDVFRPR